MADPWTHTWSWSKRPVDRNRKGQRCRVLSLVAAGASGPVVVRELSLSLLRPLQRARFRSVRFVQFARQCHALSPRTFHFRDETRDIALCVVGELQPRVKKARGKPYVCRGLKKTTGRAKKKRRDSCVTLRGRLGYTSDRAMEPWRYQERAS